MANQRVSALMISSGRPRENDFNRMKSLGPQETSLVDLAVSLRKKKDFDAKKIENNITAAVQAGATDDEIQSVYDSAVRAGLKDKKSKRLGVISKTLQDLRGHYLPETLKVNVGDHDTLLRDTHGEGVPMVLLHALTMDASMWREIYPILSQHGRVIMYDIRGFGAAENAPKTTSIDQLADDLAIVLDRLQIAQADVYGTSYGGAIAQVFTLKYPQRARSIAVLGTPPQGFPILYERASAAEQFGMEHLVPSTIRRWLLEDSIASNGWEVRYARTCVRRVKVSSWANAWRAMAEFNVTNQMNQLKSPALVVGGAQDVSAPPALVKQVAELAPKGQYVELNPGSHMMVMEQAEEVAKTLARFREQVASGNA
jgi:3-oxoadipate enol-lactonase